MTATRSELETLVSRWGGFPEFDTVAHVYDGLIIAASQDGVSDAELCHILLALADLADEIGFDGTLAEETRFACGFLRPATMRRRKMNAGWVVDVRVGEEIVHTTQPQQEGSAAYRAAREYMRANLLVAVIPPQAPIMPLFGMFPQD